MVVLVRATASPAAARGGARGAGPADLRRRRPRLLVPGAGPRRPRVAARARQPARRGGAADRPVLARSTAPAPTSSSCSPEDGRERGSLWAAVQATDMPRSRSCSHAEREHAERAPLEVLLERAIVATGYDLATLARPGGDRRLANLRKLMRLAGEYERAEGRDLRGFLADAAGARPRRGARGRGRARVRGPGRRAADDDPPRQGPRVPGRLRRRPRPQGGRHALAAARRRRTAPPACGSPRSAAATRSPRPPGSASPRRTLEADAEEERRLFYVAMTRARELLILSGGTDVDEVAARRAPAARRSTGSSRAIAGATLQRRRAAARRAAGTAAGARRHARSARPKRHAARRPRCRAAPRAARRAPDRAARPSPRTSRRSRSRARPAPQRLSYSQLTDYAKCGYRFYLERVLGLPDVDATST